MITNHRVFSLEVLITDEFLKNITNVLGNVHFPLGLHLAVARPCIERIENDFVRNTWRMTFEVLVKWRETSKSRPDTKLMIEELVRALIELKLTDAVEKVREGEC